MDYGYIVKIDKTDPRYMSRDQAKSFYKLLSGHENDPGLVIVRSPSALRDRVTGRRIDFVYDVELNGEPLCKIYTTIGNAGYRNDNHSFCRGIEIMGNIYDDHDFNYGLLNVPVGVSEGVDKIIIRRWEADEEKRVAEVQQNSKKDVEKFFQSFERGGK